jgi:ABC-type transport system involved in multi-copper enzyme maturation permease subunit
MIARVSTVALNAFREAVRARVLLGLVGVAFAVALYSMVVGAFTLTEAPRVVADLGAAAISLFSLAVAVLIGATTLHRELEQKTILPLLARPIRRSEYLVGKYTGIMLVVGTFILAEGGLVLFMSAALGGRSLALVLGSGLALVAILALFAARFAWARTYGLIPWSLLLCGVGAALCSVAPQARSLVLASATLTLFEVAVIAAVATFFSSFSTPFLSSLLTIWVWFIGRSTDALTRMPKKVFGETVHEMFRALAVVFPNLHVYVPARPLLTGEAVDTNLLSYLGMAGIQTAGWIVGLLAVSALIFERRDFL